jgi:2'-5' RNA ligase
MMKPETDFYSLWIIPEGEAYTLTSYFIARLSDIFSLPDFEPHVTLLGRIQVSDFSTLHDLARSLPPFRIRLASQPEYLDEYFRCLFLKADETPALMEAFAQASRVFDYQGGPYFPHLSLAYGDQEIEDKLAMIHVMGEIPEIEFEARQLSLARASSKIPVSNWEVVERFPIAKM